MKERMRFVVAHETDLYTMTELCERFGVSRKTGYKWVNRSDDEGPAGLEDRSRRPHHSPNETTDEIRTLLIEVRYSTVTVTAPRMAKWRQWGTIWVGREESQSPP